MSVAQRFLGMVLCLHLVFFGSPSQAQLSEAAIHNLICLAYVVVSSHSSPEALEPLHRSMEIPETELTEDREILLGRFSNAIQELSTDERSSQWTDFLEKMIERREKHVLPYLATAAGWTLFRWGDRTPQVVALTVEHLSDYLRELEGEDEFEIAEAIVEELILYGKTYGDEAFIGNVALSYFMADYLVELDRNIDGGHEKLREMGLSEAQIVAKAKRSSELCPQMYYIKMYRAWALDPQCCLYELSVKILLELAEKNQEQAISALRMVLQHSRSHRNHNAELISKVEALFSHR